VQPRVGVDDTVKREISCSCWESTHDSSAVQPTALSLRTSYATFSPSQHNSLLFAYKIVCPMLHVSAYNKANLL